VPSSEGRNWKGGQDPGITVGPRLVSTLGASSPAPQASESHLELRLEQTDPKSRIADLPDCVER
jgi:hypothetical protein